MVARLLSQKGYKVFSARDGKELVEMIAGCASFDVVLVDRYMPRLDGPNAVRWVSGWW